MKHLIRFLILILISKSAFSQNPVALSKLIYLDSTSAETTVDNYDYIRIVEKYYSQQKSYTFKEYYKSQALKAVGTTVDKDFIKLNGQHISYYENGTKKSTVNYLNNIKTGKEFNWYENGEIKSELEYYELKNKVTESKINNFWNNQKEQTVIDGNGYYLDRSEFSEESGNIKNGQPDGTWTGKHFKKKLSFTESYENGKLISGITTDSLNIKHFYTIKEQPPLPKKGIYSFYHYVGSSMRITPEAKKKNISGKILLSFVVDEEGNLVDPKIIKRIGYGLDENAINIIKGAKKWNPGICRGIPVRVVYSIPITITKNI